MNFSKAYLLPFLFSCLFCCTTFGDEINFAQKVLPILSDKCFVCHGPASEEESELRLDSFEAATEDLGGYQAIDPDAPEKSALLERIHSTDDPMPPEDAEKQLTQEERKILTDWVRNGGNYSKHWAFVPPQKSPSDLNSVDAFIEADLNKKGIELAKEADKATLARRVALILTGLPPKPGVLQSYMKDDSDNAYEQLVDKLLAEPTFGEHQARYWLDAVRYGDTHGLHLDNRRGIYPYRDWVVKAFDDNLPLDQFVTWQLAGDLLPNPTLEQLVATGYVRMNPSTSEGGAIPAEFQAKNNFDRTENFGTVFLGMSLICARCHGHKYDPISQEEYYRLMAFFNSTAEGPLDGNSYTYGPTVKAPKNQSEWELRSKLQARIDRLVKKTAQSIRGLEEKEKAKIEKEFSALAGLKQLEWIAVTEKVELDSGLKKAASQVLAEWKQLEAGFTTTLIAKELQQPRPTRLLHRGEYDQPTGEPLQPGVISVASPFPNDIPGNRLGLAKWLLSENNPLTSRVLVNRIWQRVFGAGLVRTPEDFGLQGQGPTHPELLDWLAVELRENGWNLKETLKLLVMSKTFRQDSGWRAEIDDPENKLYARGPSFRLDAEVIRDVALWASDLMVDERGGEGIKPWQPEGMWKALAHPASNTKQYVPDKGDRLYRRSLYVYWKRTSPHPMMTLFDAPSRESSCVRRSRTNTSLQSLGLFNEPQRVEFSRKLAERLLIERDSDSDRLELLFKLLICRSPSKRESEACSSLLSQMKKRFQEEPETLEFLKIGEASSNDELDPSEIASWSQVVVTVLASDIVIRLY